MTYKTLGCFVVFLGVEVVCLKTSLQIDEADAVAHIKRIDDIAERFAHFAAVGVADDWVEVHLFEWQLAS